jgi:hypothetical protein
MRCCCALKDNLASSQTFEGDIAARSFAEAKRTLELGCVSAYSSLVPLELLTLDCEEKCGRGVT